VSRAKSENCLTLRHPIVHEILTIKYTVLLYFQILTGSLVSFIMVLCIYIWRIILSTDELWYKTTNTTDAHAVHTTDAHAVHTTDAHIVHTTDAHTVHTTDAHTVHTTDRTYIPHHWCTYSPHHWCTYSPHHWCTYSPHHMRFLLLQSLAYSRNLIIILILECWTLFDLTLILLL
jgi:hypothetical protein